jgi:hypothetical protein
MVFAAVETPTPTPTPILVKGSKKGKQESEVKGLETKLKALGKELFAEKRANAAAEKERERLTLELVRVNTVKGKLEELSRELQRQNKTINEESKRSAVDEASRRQELSAKFSEAVGDINTRLALQSDDHGKQLSEVLNCPFPRPPPAGVAGAPPACAPRTRGAHSRMYGGGADGPRGQNNELRKKLMDFSERVEARENMHAKTLEAKSLECQLHEKRTEQEEHRVAEANLKVITHTTRPGAFRSVPLISIVATTRPLIRPEP